MLEVIRLVERSHLPAKQTLDKLGIPRTTFYRCYERYRLGGQRGDSARRWRNIAARSSYRVVG
jgi:putative transposase